jgi:hypothetical protein
MKASFGDKKIKHKSKDKKNAPLMSMSLLASLWNHYMKLDRLRVSLSIYIQGNPFRFHSTYFPFLQNVFANLDMQKSL